MADYRSTAALIITFLAVYCRFRTNIELPQIQITISSMCRPASTGVRSPVPSHSQIKSTSEPMSNAPINPSIPLNAQDGEKQKDRPRWLKAVHEYSKSMSTGVINLIIHEGRVTQVERTERVRFDREPLEYEI